jgi:sigma-B regulation protein RsbU (phosphoserine phosphatase)
VGGDLYDYFKVRDGNLLFAIGDVSDKGIPAALFMARLSALLRVLGADELPDRLLSAINSRLVEGNDACMFVTIGCGVLNVDSGRIRYASAGHEPPLLREVDGRVRALAAENGAAIGIETAVEYRLYEGSLAPGDALVLFTDGVTEAEGPGGTLWGIDRLTGLIGNTRDSSPGVLVKNIVDAVASHSGGFHATDDLTVLAVRFNPARVSASHDADVSRWRLDLDATLPGIQLAQQRLRCILESRGIASERIGDVDLVVEELLTNVVKAADTDRKTIQLTMNCALTPLGIEIVVRDDGTEFNPLSRPDPDLDADIVDRGVGGLGVHLIKQLADECSYARVDGLNVFMARFGRTSTRS